MGLKGKRLLHGSVYCWAREKKFLYKKTKIRNYLASAIIESLMDGDEDYCYSYVDEQATLAKIAQYNLTVAWDRHYNEYGEHEYSVFYPVKYSCIENGKRISPVDVCWRLSELPPNMNCITFRNRKPIVLKETDWGKEY